MTSRPASLPMYDADPPAVARWWRVIARHAQREGLAGLPVEPAWPDDLQAHWHDPDLLLSQTCGLPLVTSLRGVVQVVGAFRYDVPGCAGIDYSSVLVARADDPARALGDFAGRVAVVNDPGSQSGCNALKQRVGIDFFREWRVSGAHRSSIEAVREGRADVAAIDCVTLAGLRRRRPGVLEGLRVIGSTPRSPGLPLVTSASTCAADLAALRRTLAAACADAEAAEARRPLFIAGFEPAEASRWPPFDR